MMVRARKPVQVFNILISGHEVSVSLVAYQEVIISTYFLCGSHEGSHVKKKQNICRISFTPGCWHKKLKPWIIFHAFIEEMVLWAKELTLHCFFCWRTTPPRHVILYLCYTPFKLPGPLTCQPSDGETQLFGWSDLSIHFFFIPDTLYSLPA